jgi:hypothetical protein
MSLTHNQTYGQRAKKKNQTGENAFTERNPANARNTFDWGKDFNTVEEKTKIVLV